MLKEQIHEVSANKGEICNRILRSLPKWFGIEHAIVNYVREVEPMPMFVVEDHSQAVGFVALNFHNEFNAEIHVMGILPEYHGQGWGTVLAQAAQDHAAAKGARFLTVKTLSPAREDANYAATRKFYESFGFVPLEEFKTLWGEANPCLLMIKVIGC